MKRDAINLNNDNVYSLFSKYFFPTLLGMLGMSAVTAIDGIFVGHSVGSDGVAAINIIAPVMMFITGIGLMIGVGCSVASSIHLSKNNLKAARLNVTQAMIFITITAIVIIAAMLASPDKTATTLGSSEYLLPLVKEYMLWNVPSWIFMMWEAVALFIIRLDGSPKIAMSCNLITAALNVALDWLFIFPFGWGLMGAAFATSISTAAGSIIAIVYLTCFAKKLHFIRLKASIKSLKLSIRNIGYQCRTGSSAFLGEMTMAVLMFMGNQVFMHYLGDNGVGAFGIVCYYTPFIFMVGNAIAQSAQPIISYNFGSGEKGRTIKTEKIALFTAFVCGIITTSLFSLFPQFMVGLFVDSGSDAAQIAIYGFPFFAIGFVAFIFNLTAIGYFQSVERIKPATFFALLRGIILLIPSFIIMPHLLGIKGIWLAMPATEIATSVIIICFYYHTRLKERYRLAD